MRRILDHLNLPSQPRTAAPARDHADCRRQLLALYGRGRSLKGDDLAPRIARTEGVSAAFIRELLRRAALFAADAGRGTAVDEEHLKEALHELLVDGGPLTRSLLGAHAHRPS